METETLAPSITAGGTLPELQEQAAELGTKIEDLAKLNTDETPFDAEQESNWNQVNADYDFVVDAIKRKQQSREIENRRQSILREREELNDKLNSPDPSAPQTSSHTSRTPLARKYNEEQIRSLGMQAWITARRGKPISDDQRAAAQASGWDLNAKEVDIRLLDTPGFNALQNRHKSVHQACHHEIQNAPLTTTVPATGKNVVPPEELLRQLEVNMLAFGSVLQHSDVINTGDGQPISWPTVDDTGNKGRIVGENTPVDDNAGGGASGDGGPNPAFGKKTWNAYKYTSDTVLVPYELLEDSVFNMATVLGELLGERLGRISEEHFTTGTGTNQPEGVVTGSALGATSGAVATLGQDDIYNLFHSVDPSYRRGGIFMGHDSIINALRKLKDGENRPLWQSNMRDGRPDTLLGLPLATNQEMDSAVATGNKVLLFGQMSKYKVRRVNSVRFYRLEELYRANDQDGFVAIMRCDGGLLNAGTAPVKHLAIQ